jgi:hypothetical protein
MASFTKFIILAAAVLASAAPTAPTAYTTEADVDGKQNGAQCGNGQKLSCCNSGGSLLGLNCLSVPIREFPPACVADRRSTGTWLSGFFPLTHYDSWRADPEVLWFQRCRLLPDW